MKYLYTCLLSRDGDGRYTARVPDLPGCVTTGDSVPDAVNMITDAASLWLVAAEENGLPISPPTPQPQLSRSPDDLCSLLQIDTIAYRMATDTRAVRKNVSLPAWMANLADRRGLNCSQILQDALRLKLDSV